MNVKFFCPYWGSENLGYEVFLNKVKSCGYSGVEMILPYDEKEKAFIKKKAKELDLDVIALWGGVLPGDFETSFASYEKHLRNACSIEPLFVNIQTGKDFFSIEQNLAFLKLANEMQNETGIKILHETHRGKFSFAAHITRKYLEKIPSLELTADFSHWCCVSESLLEEQAENMEIAIKRSRHIHARVGFAEGPQIPDPRAPEWSETLNVHLDWWDKIIENARQSGKKHFTITPEFGPIPYMTILPFSQKPITSQWDVNLYMKNLLNERYNN